VNVDRWNVAHVVVIAHFLTVDSGNCCVLLEFPCPETNHVAVLSVGTGLAIVFCSKSGEHVFSKRKDRVANTTDDCG